MERLDAVPTTADALRVTLPEALGLWLSEAWEVPTASTDSMGCIDTGGSTDTVPPPATDALPGLEGDAVRLPLELSVPTLAGDRLALPLLVLIPDSELLNEKPGLPVADSLSVSRAVTLALPEAHPDPLPSTTGEEVAEPPLGDSVGDSVGVPLGVVDCAGVPVPPPTPPSLRGEKVGGAVRVTRGVLDTPSPPLVGVLGWVTREVVVGVDTKVGQGDSHPVEERVEVFISEGVGVEVN